MPDCARLIRIGVCKADCCGPVPFPRDVWNKLRYQMIHPAVRIEEFPAGHIIPWSETGTCVFLGTDHRCTVYENRPDICRRFGARKEREPRLQCPHVKKGATP